MLNWWQSVRKFLFGDRAKATNCRFASLTVFVPQGMGILLTVRVNPRALLEIGNGYLTYSNLRPLCPGKMFCCQRTMTAFVAVGTPRRIAAVRRFGRDRSEADMSRASEAGRSDENDPQRSCTVESGKIRSIICGLLAHALDRRPAVPSRCQTIVRLRDDSIDLVGPFCPRRECSPR